MPAGRPTICTKEICAEFEKLLAGMNYFVTCCDHLGVNKQTAYEWLAKGEAGEDAAGDWPDAYREFADSVKRGSTRGELGAVAEIVRHGRPHEIPEGMVPGQWQALMTLLERRFPDRWSRNEKREIMGKGGGPVQAEVKQSYDNDQLGQVLDILRDAGALEPETEGGTTAETD